MYDPDLVVSMDGGKVLSLVAGEDRHVAVVVHDHLTLEVVSLSGLTFSLKLPTADGGILRRGTEPMAVASSMISGTPSTITFASHGLAPADKLTLTGSGSPSTVYALPADRNTFLLTDNNGSVITPGQGGYSAAPFILTHTGDTDTSAAAVGKATFTLSAAATGQLRLGNAQDMELKLTYPDGSVRFAEMRGCLDVLAQLS